jgi:hypothetical protein
VRFSLSTLNSEFLHFVYILSQSFNKILTAFLLFFNLQKMLMEVGMNNLIDMLYVGGILGFLLLVLALAAICHKLENHQESK